MPAQHQSLILALVVGLATPAVAQQAPDPLAWIAGVEKLGWTYRSTTSDDTALIFHRLMPGVPRRIWVRAERKPGTRNHVSSVSLWELDCRGRRTRTLQLTTYPRRNLEGESTSVPVGDEWDYAIPGSIADGALEVGCASTAPSAPE